MRHIIPIFAIAIMLAASPGHAQTTQDPGADITDETSDASEGEAEGSFNRDIPEGLKGTLTEDEINDYQAQLDAASTPQERNAVRQELQRISRERHVESVQKNKPEPKGFFESMAADFKDVVSGKAARDAKANSGSGNDTKGQSANKSRSKGGSGGRSGGGRGGGKSGGGGGGGRNK